MFHSVLRTGLALAIALAGVSAFAADRDVQIRNVDFTTGIVELFNFGTVDEPMDGWRFCTHDENESLRYSGLSGFNGRTIEAGTSYFVHFNNDAPANNDSVNVSTLGGFFATPLDSGAFGMGLYINSGFGIGANIADHLQWSIDGVDDLRADERSDEAETGGVWTDQSSWIVTAADSTSIRLKDASGGLILHGPDDYDVFPMAISGAGAVPDGDEIPGTQLTIGPATGDSLLLQWGASCSGTDADYEVYEGTLGDIDSMVSLTCSTGGATSATIDPSTNDVFFIVVPHNGTDEGSYGRDSNGVERTPAVGACREAVLAQCPAPVTRAPTRAPLPRTSRQR